MRRFAPMSLLCCALLAACASPPPPVVGARQPDREVFRTAARRFAAVVVAEPGELPIGRDNRKFRKRPPQEADGGSAVPVAPDGYFLTADHVLAKAPGRQVSVLLRRDGSIRAFPARIVWRGAGGDVALLHAEVETPDHYAWTPGDRWLPRGTPIMHAGIATGFSSSAGRLLTAIPPDSAFAGSHRFKHDIPLEPGDSGGPVVDAQGRLVGVNSAVEFLIPMETAFFMESEASRPNPARLASRIAADRRTRASRQAPR
jgi:S1-C subfamily serine protease